MTGLMPSTPSTPSTPSLPWTLGGLYRRYRNRVYARARVLLGDHAAAQDIAQEVFLRIERDAPYVLWEPQPLPWLHRVTTNLSLNAVRDDNRRRELLLANAVSEARPQNVEARAAVLGILRGLPLGLRAVAVCYYVDEMTHHEIAGLLGISPRTVCNRLLAFRTSCAQLELETQQA